jgi:hypothetical protein
MVVFAPFCSTPGSQHPLHTVLPVEENGCKLLTASIGGVHAWELQQATARGAEFDVTELQVGYSALAHTSVPFFILRF